MPVTRRARHATALILAPMLGLAAFGCDDAGPAGGPMVLRPNPTTVPVETTRPTPPVETVAPVEVEDEFVEAPAFITVDGQTLEFPPAKLYLKRDGERVTVKLFGREPEPADDREAAELAQRFEGRNFYFEMQLDAPAEPGSDVAAVSADQLAQAEWAFAHEGESTRRADTPSSIILGGQNLLLQPADVLVSFEPLDETLVQVTLRGRFSQFDDRRPGGADVRDREVLVVAVLSAETLKR